MDVWIIETGDYEMRAVWGVASSLEAAVAYIKEGHEKSQVARWRELKKQDDDNYELSGEVAEKGYYPYTAAFGITRHELHGGK